jgi:beta-glucosidase
MLELPRDMRWGRVYEAYSDDPKRVADLGAAYVRGLQNAPENEGKIAVLASAKHYIGLGSLTWGTAANPSYEIDQGNVPENEQALRSQYLPPFQAAIDAGAMNVMAAIGSWGDTHIAASKYLLSDVLKDDLGFRGFVVSDWYGVNNISPNTYDATVSAVNAGIDMSMVPYDYQTFIADMKKAVASGDISEARVDDAVRRILRAKFALGLFDDRGPSLPSLKIVGSAEHRALAREAVQRSLVLLKNTNGVLPISSDIQSIRVAGSAADNIGRQAGGWTVEWQGIDGNWLPGATSILAGIRATASKETSVEYDLNGNFGGDELADVGIAIVGEKPYAEGVGDNAHPSLDSADLSAIENLRKSSRKVIVVLISGRPLIISDELPKWDALVAAWLPGSEGEGVADGLFGASPFIGTLPLSWTGLFPRGYGLK